MRSAFIYLILITATLQAVAHDSYRRNLSVNVLHYEYSIWLNDTTDRVTGHAVIRIAINGGTDSILLDLTGLRRDGKGMTVKSVTSAGDSIMWEHSGDKLRISLSRHIDAADTLELIVDYSGVPADGLIISRNRFGNRTFFSDHWPDRAHNYLPCVDHPYDKASVDFIITAPEKYMVVANGIKVEESALYGDARVTRWREIVPLATKVMAFGAAQFATELAGEVNSVPVWTWVFPENRQEGFSDYAVALKPIEYYSNIIGPYPFRKLANIQSKTIYGGMENAGAIFYAERSVTGKGRAEGLIAHETAHQWFGNSVTEADWHHVWLSEGFATYLTSVYLESRLGRTRLESDMKSARDRVLEFYLKKQKPVIDTTVTNLMELLNANSYQKGAWVLHMLRYETGDDAFFRGLRLFYERFRYSNALTEDFVKVMEEVSGKELSWFFDQWLYRTGQPELSVITGPSGRKGMQSVIIEQKQNELYRFTIELQLTDASGTRTQVVMISDRTTKIDIRSSGINSIVADPHTNLLFRQIASN